MCQMHDRVPPRIYVNLIFLTSDVHFYTVIGLLFHSIRLPVYFSVDYLIGAAADFYRSGVAEIHLTVPDVPPAKIILCDAVIAKVSILHQPISLSATVLLKMT